MNVIVRDREAFATLSHVDMRAYLQSQGWREEGRVGDKAAVLVRDVGTTPWEILLPLREDLGDYLSRIAEAVHIIAEVEERPEPSVIADLMRAGRDVIRVRVTDTANDGTLSVESGVALHAQAREVLLAAACSAHQPRPLFGNRKPPRALDYLNKVRLGQSERGSYIVTLLSPVDPSLGQRQACLGPEFEDEPFERQVTSTLIRALRATKTAIVEATASDHFEAFEDRVRQGVSANLCEALAQLIDVGGSVDLGVTWAKVRPPRPEDVQAPSKVDFGPSEGRILQEAARQFRSREPMLDQDLAGWVVRLNRGPNEPVGSAVLSVIVGGKPCAMRVDGVPERDYAKLIRANNDRKPISLDGDVYRVGRGHEVRNARNIEVLDDTEDAG